MVVEVVPDTQVDLGLEEQVAAVKGVLQPLKLENGVFPELVVEVVPLLVVVRLKSLATEVVEFV
tara:strand:- start:28 stop:219 length:192 start_codon:yes stop_codon:yes gene_type:complete